MGQETEAEKLSCLGHIIIKCEVRSNDSCHLSVQSVPMPRQPLSQRRKVMHKVKDFPAARPRSGLLYILPGNPVFQACGWEEVVVPRLCQDRGGGHL